jgi:hypothetical protein
MTTIEAKYAGVCPDCGQRFNVGERVTPDEAGEAWAHERCPEGKFDFNPADVCDSCFTIRSVSGACACVGGA